ncbi:uncharacterized protein B0I36DRAFT_369204 [Microdochium trichocladiopsis]|uniref:Uncharacterized protein n=1 Tax=Microdochium trichocladiopsis TaxID=1682393 RepID=A0A9P8XRM5_9PEZI|nr:uncharacterized protein B0I36DRAFT_369204 [Microdochium trichocladiopsis]KAH7014225.1 hypothetical protein B0I36DRAFT_369204 [Microdochium trichocladiopsis]
MAPRLPYSTGCHSCRRMKVKVIFRSMNASAASKAAGGASSGSSSSNHTGRFPLADLVPSPAAPPATPWEVNAAAFFLKSYIQKPKHGFPGYMSFLPGLLADNFPLPAHHHLHEAVLAAGCASLANVTGLSHLGVAAHRHYGRSLQLLTSALRDPGQACSDVTLSAIVVLQKYEVIAGLREPQDPHGQGLTELVRLRGPDKFRSANSQQLLSLIARRQQLQDLEDQEQDETLGSHFYGPQHDSSSDIVSTAGSGDLWRLLDTASRAGAHLRTALAASAAGARVTGSSTSWPGSELQDAMDQVYSAHLRLCEWRDRLAPPLRYRVYRVRSSPNPRPGPRRTSAGVCSRSKNDDGDTDEGDDLDAVFPRQYYLFHSVQHGAMWLGYWCAQVHLLHIYHVALHRLAPPAMLGVSPSEGVVAHRELVGRRLRATVDDICASVPYMMNEIDGRGSPITPPNPGGGGGGGEGGRQAGESNAMTTSLGAFFLLRGLYVVISSLGGNLAASRRAYVLATLSRIGHVKGIKLALGARDAYIREHGDGASPATVQG